MKRKIVALLGTVVCTVLIEMPDIIPLVDEAFLMFLIIKIWNWAGVDIMGFFTSEKPPQSDSQIIEID